jgi:hypothetical protein
MAERHLRPVEPVAEPILVMLPEGHVLVQPEDDAWPIAWAWREEKSSRELVEADLRSKRALIRRLQDDQDAKRKSFAKRDVIERWFALWQQLRKHPRSKLGPDRFDAARGRLEEGYTEQDGAMALHGQNAKPAVKDGQVFDDFEIVFRSERNLERYANLCPRETREALSAAAPGDQTAMQDGSAL